MQLRVRSIDAVLERLGNSVGQIWTPSGEPITLGETTRIISIQDPDGFFVELIEGGQAAGESVPTSSNVVGETFELIIADTDANARFYRDGAGFDPQVSEAFDDTRL